MEIYIIYDNLEIFNGDKYIAAVYNLTFYNIISRKFQTLTPWR